MLHDPEYIMWIKDQSCALAPHPQCSAGPTDAHHRIGHGRNTEKGRKRKKVPDHETIPLCNYHHTEIHHHGWRWFEAKHNVHQLKLVIHYLARYIKFLRADRSSPV